MPNVDAVIEDVESIDRASVVHPPAAGATPVEPSPTLARIWIDVPSHTQEDVTIYVVDGAWEHVLVRRVARQANPEVTWEEIGHIVELALVALRSGHTIGVDRAAAERELLGAPGVEELVEAQPAPAESRRSPEPPSRPSSPDTTVPVRPASTTSSPWSFRAGGFYGVSAYGSGLELASGPGLIVEVHRRAIARRLELGGVVTGEYRFPSTVDRGSALVRFEGAAMHLLASGTVALGARHHLMIGAGGGVELVHARATSDTLSTISFVDRNLRATPTGRVLARYGLDASSSLRLFAGVGVDLPFEAPRYLLTRANESEPVVLFEPWAVRPFVVLGLESR